MECDWNQIMIPHVSLLEEIMIFFFSHLYTNTTNGSLRRELRTFYVAEVFKGRSHSDSHGASVYQGKYCSTT